MPEAVAIASLPTSANSRQFPNLAHLRPEEDERMEEGAEDDLRAYDASSRTVDMARSRG